MDIQKKYFSIEMEAEQDLCQNEKLITHENNNFTKVKLFKEAEEANEDCQARNHLM